MRRELEVFALEELVQRRDLGVDAGNRDADLDQGARRLARAEQQPALADRESGAGVGTADVISGHAPLAVGRVDGEPLRRVRIRSFERGVGDFMAGAGGGEVPPPDRQPREIG